MTYLPLISYSIKLCYRVKGKYQGEIRPRTGAPGIFPRPFEEDLALFMKHCDLLKIPRTRQQLKDDIWHYVWYHNLTYA